MAINFPNAPANNDTYTENGIKWKYNSAYNAWFVVDDNKILANTSNNQIVYNYNDKLFSSNGIVYSSASNTVYTNAVFVKTINVEASIASSYDKANTFNNVYTTIAGANTAVGTGANTVGSAAFSKANNALANSSTVFAGNLTITGNLTVSSNTVSVNGDNISPVQSFRNKIINGNFDFWQRGTSTSTQGYTADRWTTDNTGSTFTSSRQSFTLGQTAVPGEPTYWHRTVVTSVAGASNGALVRQAIESVRTLAGQTLTLSFWAKADASKNIAVEFRQIFGTGGSPSSTVSAIGVTTCALTTSWTKYTVTATLPSISGKTLGSNIDNFLELRLWFDAGSSFNSRTNTLGQQSGTFDIAQVQLEAGSVATPFEMRPLGVELALCQRYYETEIVSGATNNDANFSDGSVATLYFNFKITKRAAPTLTALDSVGTSNRFNSALGLGGSSGQTVTAGSLAAGPTIEGFISDFGSAASTNRFSFRYTASAEL